MGNSQPSRRIGVEELYAQDGGAGGSGGGELPYPMPHHHMAAPTAGSSMAAADPTTLSSLPDLSSLVKIFVVDCPPRYDLPWQMEDQLQCTGTGKSRVVQSFTSAHHQPPPATTSHATSSHHQPPTTTSSATIFLPRCPAPSSRPHRHTRFCDRDVRGEGRADDSDQRPRCSQCRFHPSASRGQPR